MPPETSFPTRTSRSTRAPGGALAAALAILLLPAGPGACRKADVAGERSSGSRSGPSESPAGSAAVGVPPPRPAAHAVSSGYAFTPAESAAVDDFLRRNPALRVTTDSDRNHGSDGDAELKSLYGIYHAYFVRGDLNDDGVLDFVLAFVRRDLGKASWFSVVVFTGRSGAGGAPDFSSGTFLETDVTLARGDISVDRDSVVISPDLDDETVRRYRWDPAAHAFLFVRDDGDDVDTPSVSQTSGRARKGKPGVRS